MMPISEMVVESGRLQVSSGLDPVRKAAWGQFMTPECTAKFMNGLFSSKKYDEIRLLEAGAGIGSLISPFLHNWFAGKIKANTLHITAFERDNFLFYVLQQNLQTLSQSKVSKRKRWGRSVLHADFIEAGVQLLERGDTGIFTHAILNPPYKKINSNSEHRKLLKRVGIETVNLYSAFVGLAVKLLADGGELVAIIPRSFCNGPYYRPFRELIFRETAIRHIHLFNSRSDAFKDDQVLQENIIISLVKGGEQGTVTVSNSQDDSFINYNECAIPFSRIVDPNDNEKFIHVPTTPDKAIISVLNFSFQLSTLGLQVSTGPVVDFRLKDDLTNRVTSKIAPLLYPHHFDGFKINWPLRKSKKANAIKVNKRTARWLYPNNGYYVVIRRFSSKEEKRRVNASVYNSDLFERYGWVGFENHLNIIHINKSGIGKETAYGLAAFLNSRMVDEYFRQFNGHTQVNATDLRNIPYPSLAVLFNLGRAVIANKYKMDIAVIENLIK